MNDTIVIGCGGGGCNVVSGIDGIPKALINTDSSEIVPDIILFEGTIGCRGDVNLGWALATDSKDEISKAIDGFENVIVSAGLGGGTGSGVIPVIAECAKEKGMRMISIVTLPMRFEESRRAFALRQLKEICLQSDCTVVMDLDYTIKMDAKGKMAIPDLMRVVDDILRIAINGLAMSLSGPFDETYTEKVYTISHSKSDSAVKSALEALNIPLHRANIGYGRIVVLCDKGITLNDASEICKGISDVTGTFPELIHGMEKGEGHSTMLFIPISSLSL